MHNKRCFFRVQKGWWLMCASGVAVALIGAVPEPRSLTVRTPDWGQEDRKVWHDGVSDVSFHLRSIREDALAAVADQRLSVEKHLSALRILGQFSAKYTAKELIKSITIEDRRTHTYADWPIGRYPVVTVLSDYGTAVNMHVQFALAHEADAHRRQLLCDVLEKISGLERAVQELDAYLHKRTWTPAETENVQAAIAELRRRQE